MVSKHTFCSSEENEQRLEETNVQHLRATARFSSHCTEVCKVDSHVSHRCASHSPQQSSNIRAIHYLCDAPADQQACACDMDPIPEVQRPGPSGGRSWALTPQTPVHQI